MSWASPLQRLLHHAQHLFALSGPDPILARSSAEVRELSGAERTFASCCMPRQSWEQGVHTEVDRAGSRPASAAARSALFAVHRRLGGQARTIGLARGRDNAAIFAGLRCGDDVETIHVIPIVHRTGRVWGEFAMVGGTPVDGISEVARFAAIALENAQRLAFARRDQDRLLLLAEATDDAFYEWDLDSRDFWWGGGIRHLYGTDADPIENTARWKRERVHPDDAARVRDTFERARATHAMRWESEYRFARHDGTYLHVEDRAYFLRDVSGRAYRIVGSIRDVTALTRMIAREQASRAEAERANRAKDEFLAMLGHELRNPLAPIVAGIELVRLRGRLDSDRELDVLDRQARHMIRLVDDLLDISRIAHGKIELKRERFEVAEVIAAAIETARPLVDARRHRLTVDVAADGLEVEADRARLAQSVGNLINNAAKYTEAGGTIAISARRDGATIAIAVRDDGMGIAPEMLPHVFTTFVQERQALDRSQGGLGLGLSIVKSLVELHGGTVAVASEGRGQGAAFTIRLPATTPGDAVAVAPPRAPVAAAAPSLRIVVVDDNEDAAEILAELLTQLGHEVRIAHDAPGALVTIDRFVPELAILDIGLPDVDGYELARRIRDRHGPHLHLVALTGYGQDAHKARAQRAGFDDHMVKPAALDKLRELLGRVRTSHGPRACP